MARRQRRASKPDPFEEDTGWSATLDVLSPRPGQPQVVVSLEDIEKAARNLECEVLFGPQKVKLVRVVYTYLPDPSSGPGMWRCAEGNELFAAALAASTVEGLQPEHIRALRLEDFEEDGPLKDRLKLVQREADET